jgi:hypothetical protein
LHKLGKSAGAAAARLRGCLALGRERHECDIAGALDGSTKLTLMSSTITGDAAWDNFAALSDQVPQPLNIFIIDIFDFIRTEPTDLFARKPSLRCHSPIASCAS